MGKRAREHNDEHWCQTAARVIERHVEQECTMNQAKNTVAFSAPRGTRIPKTALRELPPNTKLRVGHGCATVVVAKRAKVESERPTPTRGGVRSAVPDLTSDSARYTIPPSFEEHAAAIKERLRFAAEHVVAQRDSPFTLVTQKAFQQLLVIVKVENDTCVEIGFPDDKKRRQGCWLEYDGEHWLFVQTHGI